MANAETKQRYPIDVVSLQVEFTGGLELLFSNQRRHNVSLQATDEAGRRANMGALIRYLCDSLMSDKRKDMFVIDGEVRPGVLVLINDADWELEGANDYLLREGDAILFVSTLHGG